MEKRSLILVGKRGQWRGSHLDPGSFLRDTVPKNARFSFQTGHGDRMGTNPKMFPSVHDAPAKLLGIDGHCGLLAAWCVIRYYHWQTSADRLIRLCGYTRRHGVFTIGLAVALNEHGLDVAFHTEPDFAMKTMEEQLYKKARGLRIPVLPPLSVRELLDHVALGQIPIVFYDTPSGQGHFSPLLGERHGRLILPHSEGGTMSRGQFAKDSTAPEILRQCVIIKGRKNLPAV